MNFEFLLFAISTIIIGCSTMTYWRAEIHSRWPNLSSETAGFILFVASFGFALFLTTTITAITIGLKGLS